MRIPAETEMVEGPDSFERFRKAVKTIVIVPKSVVTRDRKKAASKKRTHRKSKTG
jgi:hypothetical protein